jgi:hypothetical protein
MTRFLLCGALALGLGATARAGELDREAKSAAPAAATTAPDAAAVAAASELDKESPQDAWRHRGWWGGYRGYHGYRGHWGGYRSYGGFYGYRYAYSYRPFGYSYAYSYYPGFRYGCYW